MKKIITALVLMLSFSFAQEALYHMQSLIGPKDGVTGKQFETALKKHNKVHTSDLNALNTSVSYTHLTLPTKRSV